MQRVGHFFSHSPHETQPSDREISNGATDENSPSVTPTGQKPQKSLPRKKNAASNIRKKGRAVQITGVSLYLSARKRTIPGPKFAIGSRNVARGETSKTIPKPARSGIAYMYLSGAAYPFSFIPQALPTEPASSWDTPRGHSTEQNTRPNMSDDMMTHITTPAISPCPSSTAENCAFASAVRMPFDSAPDM